MCGPLGPPPPPHNHITRLFFLIFFAYLVCFGAHFSLYLASWLSDFDPFFSVCGFWPPCFFPRKCGGGGKAPLPPLDPRLYCVGCLSFHTHSGAVVSHPIFFSDQLFYCSNIIKIICGKVTKIDIVLCTKYPRN